MPNPWLPTAERIGCTRNGGSYDGTPYCWVVHTTEGVPSTIAACRRMAETHTSPPQLWYHPGLDWLAQGIPLNRSGYALAHPPGAPETNKAGAIQTEIFGYAADTPTWPDEWLDRIGRRVLGAILEAGYPIDLTQIAPTTGNNGYGYRGAVRFTAAQWATFPGVCCHSNVAYNEHWDAGAINLHRIVAAAQGATPTPPVEEPDVNAPAIAYDPSGEQWVFATGTDKALWARKGTGDWFTLGGELTSGPDATLLPSGRLAVVGRGSDGQTWQRTLATNGDWEPWYPLGGKS